MPKPLMLLVQHTDFCNNERDFSLTNKFFVCENCYVTVSELHYGLMEVATSVRANMAHMLLEEDVI